MTQTPRRGSGRHALSRHKRGYDAAWVRLRTAYIRENPLCEDCLDEGRVNAGRAGQPLHVDHKVPFEGKDDPKRLDWDNLRTRCVDHHALKTARDVANRRGTLHPTWLPKARCRVVIVCGPPAAGKTTYVRERARLEDIVIDLDDIRAAVSGGAPYQDSDQWLGPALYERNRRLALLERAPDDITAWFIVGAPKAGERAWWKRTLGADEVIVFDTPAPECIRRIKADTNRAPVTVRQTEAAVKWWALYSGRDQSFREPYSNEIGADGWPLSPDHPVNR